MNLNPNVKIELHPIVAAALNQLYRKAKLSSARPIRAARGERGKDRAQVHILSKFALDVILAQARKNETLNQTIYRLTRAAPTKAC